MEVERVKMDAAAENWNLDEFILFSIDVLPFGEIRTSYFSALSLF